MNKEELKTKDIAGYEKELDPVVTIITTDPEKGKLLAVFKAGLDAASAHTLPADQEADPEAV
jgi:hypothetical protein